MTKQEQLKNLIDETSILSGKIDAPDIEDFSNEEELREYIQERIHEFEIIYYIRAIEYLSYNDPSLMESFEIANDMGCDCKDLNSEKLATMHVQQKMSEELTEIDFSELFED